MLPLTSCAFACSAWNGTRRVACRTAVCVCAGTRTTAACRGAAAFHRMARLWCTKYCLCRGSTGSAEHCSANASIHYLRCLITSGYRTLPPLLPGFATSASAPLGAACYYLACNAAIPLPVYILSLLLLCRGFLLDFGCWNACYIWVACHNAIHLVGYRFAPHLMVAPPPERRAPRLRACRLGACRAACRAEHLCRASTPRAAVGCTSAARRRCLHLCEHGLVVSCLPAVPSLLPG